MLFAGTRYQAPKQVRGDVSAEDLDGNGSLMLAIGSQIDGGHASAAELPLDRVSIGEAVAEAGQRICHEIAPGTLPSILSASWIVRLAAR